MLIKNSKPICVWKNSSLLGEGTLWIPILNSILFVDIKKNKIFILNTRSKKKKIIKTDKKIGFVSHVKKNVFGPVLFLIIGQLILSPYSSKRLLIFFSKSE